MTLVSRIHPDANLYAPPPYHAECVREGEGPGRDVRAELTQGVTCGEADFAEPLAYDAEDGDGVREDRGLRVAGLGQLVGRAPPHEPRERESQHLVRLLEGRPRHRPGAGERLAHPHLLRPLSGKEEGQPVIPRVAYHRYVIAPQVKPAPKAAKRMFVPVWITPWSTASESATGIVAELMLP